MKNSKPIFILFLTSMLFFTSCELNSLMQLNGSLDDVSTARYGNGGGGGGGGGDESSVGSNLSFPVIWAEGTTLTLRTPPVGVPMDGYSLSGEWWYVWGVDPIDPSYPIFSCLPITGADPCYPAGEDVYKAWVQKDAKNFWQASAVNPIGPTNIDVIDWGDNLESVDWYLTSKVRTEVGLYKNAPIGEPFRQYAMRHVFGWGTDELHGLQTTLDDEIVYGPGTEATVYSEHARLTIQKITSETPTLTWDAENSMWTGNVLDPVFSRPVWEVGDGPGFYNAEVNIKGKIIYGYTWDVKQANDGVGVYRITFSFDEEGPITALNTFFTDGTIIEGAEIIPGAEGGTKAVVDPINNLTYIDVTILGNKGGGKGGKGQ
jgi:hypothetical protein